MDLRKLSQANIEQVLSVWKQCFHDSDEFLAAYFEFAMRVEDGIGIFDGDKLVSDLFALSTDAQLSGMVYSTEFLAGCATLPEARNQHHMRDLIQFALQDMQQRSISVTYLHPFLHSFYQKFGYETVSYVTRHVAQAASQQDVIVASSYDKLPVASLFASYTAYISQFGNYFMRSQQRMEAWLRLLFADGGKIAYIECDDNTPYALFYPATDSDGQTVSEIFELVFFDDEQRTKLTTGTGADSSYYLPAGPKDVRNGAEEYTMMRVVCPEILLANYQYARGTDPFVINIHDAFLQKDYNLEVIPKAGGGADLKEVQEPAQIVADIRDVARFFTGTFDPAAAPNAAKVFQTNSSCFFETY